MKYLILAAVLLMPAMTFAQNTKADEQYCSALGADVDHVACLKEQRNARAQKDYVPVKEVNRFERCRPFFDLKNEPLFRDCVLRVKEGTTSGSVNSGGTITELHEIIQ